jgi:hypothetical protein
MRKQAGILIHSTALRTRGTEELTPVSTRFAKGGADEVC